MRILFHIEPLHFHNRPFHYWAWLGRAAAMGRLLAGRGWDVRWLMNAALAVRATSHEPARRSQPSRQGHGLPRDKVVVLHQEELRAPFGCSNMQILQELQHGGWPEAAVRAHGERVRERLGGFTPDAIVTWTPADHLRAVFPEALILHTENGIFSREPYPAFQFFDPQGLYGRSLLATHADALRARVPSKEERAWLAAFRARVREHHASDSPFHSLVADLRGRYRRVALLPLQFAGEAGFELNAPFRNQGEFLWHVLERLPDDVALLVTEHPIAHWVGDVIDEETREYLAAAAPQARFIPLTAALHGGQVLLHHCDAVISVSSSLGLQALAFDRLLVSPGTSHLRAWAHSDDPARAGDEVPASEFDGVLAWLLQHYSVRDARCHGDAEWLDGWLRRFVQRWRAGLRGLEALEPTEPLAALESAMLAAVPAPRAARAVSDAALRNGDFAETGSGGVPSQWQLVPGRRAQVRCEAVACDGRPDGAPERAARVTRDAVGDSPTLLLQRLPDATVLAGAAVTVDLLARGPLGASLAVYLYQQPGRGGAEPQGTPPRAFGLESAWQPLSYTARVPEVDVARLGAGHHTELVLLLPPDVAGDVEISAVRLSPARFD